MWAVRFCVLILILAAGTLLGQRAYTQSEIEAGKQQYAANCTRCHGPDGDALANADIGHGKFRRATSDDELVRIIRNGVPETTRAAAHNISEPNAATIVAYLRSMAATAAASAALPPGNATRGKTVFEGKGGCASCHRVGDNGSRVGPDLSQIGGARRMVEIQRSILEPDAEVVPANRTFRVITRDGATITGRRSEEHTSELQSPDH